MKFTDVNIDKNILKALSELRFSEMTEIQEKTISLGIAGEDLIGQAMTGSGKTAAFGIPLIMKTEPRKGVQSLILTPTRELCNQVAESLHKFSKYSGVQVAAVYGGVGIEPQIQRIRHSEIVVGTPGRIMDHMERRTLTLQNVKILVLDEADRMLDMGFVDDIRRIVQHVPKNRQTMLFSATMPDPIIYIARHYMKNPIHVKTQKHVAKHLLKNIYYNTKFEDKPSLLVHLINKEKPSLALIFAGTRRTADFVNRYLQQNGIESMSLHGGHSQNARENILEGFHRGRPHILVATDVAARGLDIKDVSHVFNYDIPKSAEDYTHRIGRTARSGKAGKAISLLCREDHRLFQGIVKYIEIEKAELEDFEPKPVSRREPREGGGGFGGRRGFHSRDRERKPQRRRW